MLLRNYSYFFLFFFLLLSCETDENDNNDNDNGDGFDRTSMLINWADSSKGIFTGLIIPNVFGPFGKPNYNSVIATFCHKITIGEKPEIHIDAAIA